MENIQGSDEYKFDTRTPEFLTSHTEQNSKVFFFFLFTGFNHFIFLLMLVILIKKINISVIIIWF